MGGSILENESALKLVFGELNGMDIPKAGRVCKIWHKVSESEEVWMRAMNREYASDQKDFSLHRFGGKWKEAYVDKKEEELMQTAHSQIRAFIWSVVIEVNSQVKGHQYLAFSNFFVRFWQEKHNQWNSKWLSAIQKSNSQLHIILKRGQEQRVEGVNVFIDVERSKESWKATLLRITQELEETKVPLDSRWSYIAHLNELYISAILKDESEDTLSTLKQISGSLRPSPIIYRVNLMIGNVYEDNDITSLGTVRIKSGTSAEEAINLIDFVRNNLVWITNWRNKYNDMEKKAKELLGLQELEIIYNTTAYPWKESIQALQQLLDCPQSLIPRIASAKLSIHITDIESRRERIKWPIQLRYDNIVDQIIEFLNKQRQM